jgi:hypothetical protein
LASGAHLLYCARFSLTMDPLFAVVLAMSSYEAGRVVGNMAIPLALLAGAIKCVQIMRRPTTSTVCVTSLPALRSRRPLLL